MTRRPGALNGLAGHLAGVAGVMAGQVAPYIEGGREFAAGWIEGRWRYGQDPHNPPPGWFPAKTRGRAASQAAVAFYRAMDGLDDVQAS